MELNVPGFNFLIASVPVNPFMPASLALATYNGKLTVPYPPFSISGSYNAVTNRIVFEKRFSLPFNGLTLEYRVEVNPVELQIVKRYFNGRLNAPVFINVNGTFDGITCILDLSGNLHLPSEKTTVASSVSLVFCNNCSMICSAQAVSLSVSITQPWNISLHGGYILGSNGTAVTVGGKTEIKGIEIDIFAKLSNAVDRFSIAEFILVLHVPPPLNFSINGTYSNGTGTFKGAVRYESLHFMLNLTVDFDMNIISNIDFHGTLVKPFVLEVEGSYKLSTPPHSNNLTLMGSLKVENFLNLKLVTRFLFSSHSLTTLAFQADLFLPFYVQLSAEYNKMQSSILNMMGSVKITESHSVMLKVQLNTSSDPLTVNFIELSGVFPYPLDMFPLKGRYSRKCLCANVSGSISQHQEFSVTLSTILSFSEETSVTIDTLNVSIHFSKPLNFRLKGQYTYSNMSTSVISAEGAFETPYVNLTGKIDIWS